MSTEFCTSCRKVVHAAIESRMETFPVRGEDIEIESKVAVCPECAQELSVEELDGLSLQTAFEEYRRRHGLLAPEEIRGIREKYGLSQRAFSLVLGWGEITAHRYESGSLQDPAHDAQLRMAAEPRNMVLLIDANGGRLTSRQKLHLESVLADLQKGSGSNLEEPCFSFMGGQTADEYSGFRVFDGGKFSEMVVYFAGLPSMFRTKLNKLLFYADFLNSRDSAVSITGARYLAFERGPVPEHYDWIAEALERQGDVRAVEWTDGEKSGDILKSMRQADTSVFSASELRVLEFVRDRLAGATSKELMDLSHAEAAYSNTARRALISYRWSEELSVSIPD